MASYKIKFLVVTSAPTLKSSEGYKAYAPYVKEMDIWFDKVAEVGIISPVSYPHNVFLQAFQRKKIFLIPLPFIALRELKDFFSLWIKLPVIFYHLNYSFSWADHVHIRCPGNIGLIACLVQIFYPNKSKTVKYAGNWDLKSKQPWTYRLQKWILNNTYLTKNMQVLVYGEWPGQSKNIKSFFTASFYEKAKFQMRKKNFSGPLKFIFVGNLVLGKNPLDAIKIVHYIQRELSRSCNRSKIQMEIYGEGPERAKLENYCRKEKLDDLIFLKGIRTLEELKEVYQNAHFVMLPSNSEGWPKAIAEGMFFGCIPIASRVSCVSWMLGNGSRGILIPDDEYRKGGTELDRRYLIEKTVENLIQLINNPAKMRKMSLEAQEWSQKYTLEKFGHEIEKLLAPPPISHREQKVQKDNRE